MYLGRKLLLESCERGNRLRRIVSCIEVVYGLGETRYLGRSTHAIREDRPRLLASSSMSLSSRSESARRAATCKSLRCVYSNKPQSNMRTSLRPSDNLYQICKSPRAFHSEYAHHTTIQPDPQEPAIINLAALSTAQYLPIAPPHQPQNSIYRPLSDQTPQNLIYIYYTQPHTISKASAQSAPQNQVKENLLHSQNYTAYLPSSLANVHACTHSTVSTLSARDIQESSLPLIFAA